jgi:hypothetical protein
MHDHGALTWRGVVDKHCAALVDELAATLDSELERVRTDTAARTAAETKAAERSLAASAAEIAREKITRETRLATAESLNQALRRIRQASSQSAVFSVLLDSAAPFSRHAVVLRVENNQVRSLGARGLAPEGSAAAGSAREGGGEPEFAFDLTAAAAVANVCENRDPVTALASANELSPELAAALSEGDITRRAYLFPIAIRQDVIAVLGAGDESAPAALELLSEAAGMKLETLEPAAVLQPLPNPELIQIAKPSVPETPGAERLAWSDLSPEDQKLHLQAQRVARVKVAEMRLYHSEELRKGVFEGDIYGVLRGEIERARAEFQQTFLSKSPTMVDYLHLEVLRSLAHEDDRLLGLEYPGPMV